MPGINFDIDGARRAGYGDEQIADALAAKAGFDSAGARQAGFKDADIIARLAAPVPPTPVPPTPVAPTPSLQVDDPGALMSTVIGAGRTFDRIGKGMQQAYYGVTGNEKAQAELKERADEETQLYGKLKEIRPLTTGLGEALPSIIATGGVGAGATALGTTAKLAAAGAVPAALEYGSAEERAKAAAFGAAGNVVGGQVLPKVLQVGGKVATNSLKGLVGNVTPEALKLAAKAEQLGIKVNAAQLGDSKFMKTLASSLEQMPFTGAATAASNQRGQFTRAVSNTFGENTDKVTPEVYAIARKRLGKQFDDLSARNDLKVDRALMGQLRAIATEAEQMADDGTIKAVNNTIDRLTRQSDNGSIMGPGATFKVPGPAYSSMDSSMSDIIKSGGEKGSYIKKIQSAVRQGMDNSISPADKAAWDQTRTQYKNLKAVRDVVARDVGDGNIPPMQLLSALNNTEAGKEAMAMGTRGNLGEIAHVGRRFVRDTVPNSGTAQRALAMGLIGGGGFAFGASPAEVAGMLVGGATAGRTLNKILMSPKTIEALSKQGLTVAQLMKMPPSKITQIIGGAAGMTAADNMEK